MAVDKKVDSSQLDSNLKSVADAIRTKGGTSADLAFPDGFISAIQSIQTGANYVKGSFTTPNTGSSYTLEFGKSFSKYIFLIEADDDAKDTIKNSGYNANKTYSFFGIRPTRSIGTTETNWNTILSRINPSSPSSASSLSTSTVFTDSSITIGCYDLSTSGATSSLYRNMKYNYWIFEIE